MFSKMKPASTIKLSAAKLSAAAFSACFLFSQTATAIQLIPHRVVYDLKLSDATERSGVTALSGRMVYEFSGSECEGYTVNFRSVSEIYAGETARVSDQQASFYENSEDQSFSFINRSYLDEKLDTEVNGRATTAQDGEIEVSFKKPDQNNINLPKSQFPTANLIDLIERAKSGERIYETRIFDGSDGGEKSLITTSIIGEFEQPENLNDKEIKIIGEEGKAGYWPVSISYFEEAEGGDTLPVYRFAFKLYENGVSRDLTLDHGYLVIGGKVSNFEILDEAEAC